MPMLDVLLAVGLFSCIALVVFTYAIYPVLIWALARMFGGMSQRPGITDEELPTVSLVIAARDEEKDIQSRIENALALNYPKDKLEIIIASDGSKDRTNEIVGRFAAKGLVRLFAFPVNRGKAPVLNEVLPQAKGDILVLSDANTSNDPESVRQLVAWFQDPTIGAVCGRLDLKNLDTGKNVDSLYWKYETFLKKCESKLGALLGSNGGIYAIRKNLYQPIPPDTIVDDFVIPLIARERSGCRIVYDTDAFATEETPKDIRDEFRRRSRIGAGGFQSIGILWGLLNPRHGWISFTFLSHKILRWLCPFFMVGALLLNGCLLHYPILFGLMMAQAAFYGLSLIAAWLPTGPKICKFARLSTMFTTMNLALLFGFYRWITGRQKAAWTRTERGVEQPIETALTGILPNIGTARIPG